MIPLRSGLRTRTNSAVGTPRWSGLAAVCVPAVFTGHNMDTIRPAHPLTGSAVLICEMKTKMQTPGFLSSLLQFSTHPSKFSDLPSSRSRTLCCWASQQVSRQVCNGLKQQKTKSCRIGQMSQIWCVLQAAADPHRVLMPVSALSGTDQCRPFCGFNAVPHTVFFFDSIDSNFCLKLVAPSGVAIFISHARTAEENITATRLKSFSSAFRRCAELLRRSKIDEAATKRMHGVRNVRGKWTHMCVLAWKAINGADPAPSGVHHSPQSPAPEVAAPHSA